MKLRAIAAFAVALTVGIAQAGEQGSWLSSIFKSVLSGSFKSNTQTQKNETKMAYAAHAGFAAIVLGWFGYKAYKNKQKELEEKIPAVYATIQEKQKERIRLARETFKDKEEREELEEKFIKLRKKLCNILITKGVKGYETLPEETFVDSNVGVILTSRTNQHLYSRYKKTKAQIELVNADIAQKENHRRNLKQHEDEIYKRNSSVLNYIFSR